MEKFQLLVDVRGSKTSVLKLSNNYLIQLTTCTHKKSYQTSLITDLRSGNWQEKHTWPNRTVGSRFNFFIVACRLCENLNDSLEMETCLATPKTIITNEETEWKHFFKSQIKTLVKVLE